ncbi:MAG: hypothetical protein AAB091_00495 [Elusimicrobiota bacterium]
MNVSHLMRARHVGIKDFKIHLSAFLDQNKPLLVTERGNPKHFVVPYEEMLEIIDILEEASDPNLVAQVERARMAYKKGGGRAVDLPALRKALKF